MLTVQTSKALYFACAGGYNNCVKLLIEHGTNINAEVDITGNRPLHLALLETGAKINMNDIFHRTPLSVARSRLNILMKNIESANVDVEEMVEDNEHIPENRETFVQGLQLFGQFFINDKEIVLYNSDF
ncbi:22127_t:CDS:2 [Gigaspora margarita]|uniref:22127_t:CDS:1 n=1 Tax=Gigaspora margarita TaxID=4874 RepID=A0ABN7VAP9_GIGMA|nr:22127_t:CDS:2 [Gigaspora margarita]